MTNIDTQFTRHLLKEMANRGISEQKLAHAMGWLPSKLSRKLHGQRWSLEDAALAATAIRVPLDVLITGGRSHSNLKSDFLSVTDVENRLGHGRAYVLNLIHAGILNAMQPKPRADYLISRHSFENYEKQADR